MTDLSADVASARTRPAFHGAMGELFRIHIVNILLGIVTIGIYRFWAKTRIRRYMWGRTSFLDDRFEYSGTGKELFLGFLIVLAILLPFGAVYFGLYVWLIQETPDNADLVQIPYFIVIVFLVGAAIFRARRYRLSRTLWRGIRGAQSGSTMSFAGKYLGYLTLSIITLGWFTPFKNVKLASYLFNNTYVGDRRFRFEGRGGDLIKAFAISWILFIPTLGISWFWYRAAELRYIAAHTRYEDLSFESGVRGGPLAWLVISNFLIQVFTLSIAYPVVLVRSIRFICDNLEIVGEQDFAAIAQSTAAVPGRGEGLAEAFDVGGI